MTDSQNNKPEYRSWLLLAGAVAVFCALVLLMAPQKEPPAPQAVPQQLPQSQVQLPPPPETTEPAEEIPAPWCLLLVNPWNTIPEDFTVELQELEDGQAADKRICSDLQNMLEAMDREGLKPVICSSYRTEEKQQYLFTRKVNYYLERGYSLPEADEAAGRWVAVPGTSEHQTGLALDIVDAGYPYLDEAQENTAVQKWLMKHSWEYGFILRYPSDKSEITGINYEPWHYRYVGKESAADIYEQDICLEEYLAVG